MTNSAQSGPPYDTAGHVAARVLAVLARAPRMMLATDFDGTLAPIREVGAEARADPRALDALDALGRAGVATCIATGRTLESLEARLGRALPACARVAEHGATIVRPGAAPERAPVALHDARALAEVRAALEAVAARFAGAALEPKATAIALHVRAVAGASRDAIDALLPRLAADARARGLHAMLGRAVLEVRAPLADKGDALGRLLREHAGDAGALVYAGDDTTDEPALELAARSGGVAVYIPSPERPAPTADVASLAWLSQPAWVDALVAIARGVTAQGA